MCRVCAICMLGFFLAEMPQNARVRVTTCLAPMLGYGTSVRHPSHFLPLSCSMYGCLFVQLKTKNVGDVEKRRTHLEDNKLPRDCMQVTYCGQE